VSIIIAGSVWRVPSMSDRNQPQSCGTEATSDAAVEITAE